MKEPRAVLHIEDFVNTFELEGTRQNPHRFKKKEVLEELVGGLFGCRCGRGGRAGYKWEDCTDKSILAQVKHLHPIVYSMAKTACQAFWRYILHKASHSNTQKEEGKLIGQYTAKRPTTSIRRGGIINVQSCCYVNRMVLN